MAANPHVPTLPVVRRKAVPRTAGVVAVGLCATFTALGAAAAPASVPVAAAKTDGIVHRLGVGVVAAPAQTAPTEAAMRARLTARAKSAPLRPRTVGVVMDRATGRVIWSASPRTAVMPASLTKVTTAVSAYRWLGPQRRLTTKVVRRGSSGSVVLVGAGDPMLTSGDLSRLAATTAARLKAARRTSIVVVVDDHLFSSPTSAPGWKRSYVPSTISPVRALGVHGRHVLDTGTDAGKIFAKALTAKGVKVTRVTRGTAPRGSAVLAQHASPTVATLVKRMLLVSDNQIAETLYKLSARGAHQQTTWAGGRRARDKALNDLGVRGMVLYDGSGLSRSDRITALQFASLLRAVARTPKLAPITNGLPVAGVSGTLARRYRTAPTSCARQSVAAKTGTLNDVIGLGGYASTASGRPAVIVFVQNGPRTSHATVTTAIDRLATTVVGCW